MTDKKMTDKEVIQWLVAQRDKAVDFNVELTPEIKEIRNRVAAKRREAYDVAIRAIEQARWIPVSERLPEESGCYLVTTKWKGSYSGDVYIETNMAVYREKQKEWDCVDVIAWMPLPEPYKEESEV